MLNMAIKQKLTVLAIALSVFGGSSSVVMADNVMSNTAAQPKVSPYTLLVIPNAAYLCDDAQQQKCKYYEVVVSLPLKDRYARRPVIQNLMERYVQDAMNKVDKKSSHDLNLISLDIKGDLYRSIDYVDRAISDQTLEKFLIDVHIKR